MVYAVADIDTPPAMPGVNQAPAAAMVVVDVSVPEAAVDEDRVDAVNAVEPDKADAAMADEVAAAETANGEPMTTEAMTTETMAATAAATATGVGDLRQRDDHGDKHCKHQIEQLTTHDTLLLQAFFSRRHRRARIVAKLRVVFIAVNLSQRPPASGARHDGVAGIAALDHERIRALPDQLPRRRDLDAQRRPALDARARRIVLRRNRPGNPGNCNGEYRQPRHRFAHGLSSVGRATVSHHGAGVNLAL
jgi:hypothetical protein